MVMLLKSAAATQRIYYDYKPSDKLCSHVPVGRLYFGSRPFRMAHGAVAAARGDLSDGF
jgi:hypothetical protein